MISQLKYVANMISVINLYEQPVGHDIDTKCFEMCSCEYTLYNNFLRESVELANLKEIPNYHNMLFQHYLKTHVMTILISGPLT